MWGGRWEESAITQRSQKTFKRDTTKINKNQNMSWTYYEKTALSLGLFFRSLHPRLPHRVPQTQAIWLGQVKLVDSTRLNISVPLFAYNFGPYRSLVSFLYLLISISFFLSTEKLDANLADCRSTAKDISSMIRCEGQFLLVLRVSLHFGYQNLKYKWSFTIYLKFDRSSFILMWSLMRPGTLSPDWGLGIRSAVALILSVTDWVNLTILQSVDLISHYCSLGRG